MKRIQRLRTVTGVGPVTTLTRALEMGDVNRFRSLKQAISYCGLCGEEKSSADKVMCTPFSKQRNKHIQRVLVEAAKLAPRQNHEPALVYEKEKKKENGSLERKFKGLTCAFKFPKEPVSRKSQTTP
jgi:transposase